MSDTEEIATGALAALTHAGRRLFWLENDPDAEPITDELDREVPRQKLISHHVENGERSVLARRLPPGHTLAATSESAFVWDPRGGAVNEVSFDGTSREVTRIEGHFEGELVVADETLYYVGKIHAGAMGVVRFDHESDGWERRLDTEDPTPGAHAMIHIDGRGVHYLHHGVDGWMIDTTRPDGTTTSRAVDLAGLMPRELSGGAGNFFVALKRGVLFVDETGERLGVVETDVPPERLADLASRVGWVANAVRDSDGKMLEPWRAQVASVSAPAPSTLVRSDRPITRVVGGDWGCACFAKGPTADFPAASGVNQSVSSILLARG